MIFLALLIVAFGVAHVVAEIRWIIKGNEK